ncbi:MAG: (d)CMP kinase [Nitrospinaceae bacterium]|jgi:cytidylate kinase|nr:(d)CMP kinase [Nitrospinaceae bacterium]MDP7149066.1 (d)CMP kinase [Nitrospinaceae bacterium]MDP7556644.1 (d)CMP kinase [Nitrospinaceae bacterium]MDP7611142.1 (d)CMP kinase [Nitrospinaceae bacterium]HAX45898.1 (d)CMP kinase [Nitrospina sp.]|tara:strand:+ start:2159 stop:2824 length:666 start_codon:yes stop_codon:yes gene_type:complete
MIIAIDGPAGSGKSTIAKIVAEKLHFRYIDTGSMYRSVAWKSLQKKVTLGDEDAVANIARETKIELVPGENGQSVFIDGENITSQLKEETISRGAAIVAAQPIIREIMTAKQRELGKQGQVVMDGRDIGTVVFPQADKKFFMDADPEERGRRRFTELKDKKQIANADLATIIEQVKQRDQEDRNRKIAPLKQAEDAILIDTTHLSIDQVVEQIMKTINSGP